MFDGLLQWLVTFVAEPSLARAIVFGLVSGVMLTQWVKFQLPEWLSDRAHAIWVRLTASLLTFATVLALWPPDYADSWIAALAIATGTGLTTPFAYWLGVKLLYRYLPEAETVISARPASKEPPV